MESIIVANYWLRWKEVRGAIRVNDLTNEAHYNQIFFHCAKLEDKRLLSKSSNSSSSLCALEMAHIAGAPHLGKTGETGLAWIFLETGGPAQLSTVSLSTILGNVMI